MKLGMLFTLVAVGTASISTARDLVAVFAGLPRQPIWTGELDL